MACINRSVEDVESLIEYAKLESSSFLSTTQTLEFPEDYDASDTVLMQLPPKLLNVLKKGDQLVLRGEDEDFAVLCTENETYEVREAETSNSLVLVPGLQLPESIKSERNENRKLSNKIVTGIHYKYFELKECLPRTHKLRKLLLESPYSGPQEDESDESRYTFSELLERVQCSDEQMRDALDKIPALHMGGHWRMLDFDYQFKVVSDILALIEEHQWPLDGVPKTQVLRLLEGVEPKPVLQLCLNFYFKVKEDCDGILCLVDDKMSRLFAEVLLRPAGKFNLTEFLTIWEQSVPPGVVTHLSQLEGLALVDRSTSPPVISHCPVEAMPEDAASRFLHLFEIKDKWTLQEITPYVQDLSGPKCTVSSLLAKHTRGSTHNGIKHFTAKHSR